MEDGIKASSATIRNDMAVLENLGLIAKEHTSSGRVPTMKGYRFYVDHLLRPSEVPSDELQLIRKSLGADFYEIDDIVKQSAKILSDLTSYTAFSFGPEMKERKLTGFRILPINANQVIAIIVTDNGNVESQVFNLPENVDEEDLERMIRIVNDRMVGEPLMTVYNRLRTEIPMILHKYFQTPQGMLELFERVLDGAFKESVFVSGRMNLLDFGLVKNIQDFKSLYQFFGDVNQVTNLVTLSSEASEHEGKSIDIRIGSELNNRLFQEMSLITATYDVEGHGKGAIALLGPNNMEYSKMFGLVDTFRTELAYKLTGYYCYLDRNSGL